MCIDIIHETFPNAVVEWERTPRVSNPQMTVDETTSGDEILTFTQRDMSDDYLGNGVDALRKALQKYRAEN